MTQMLIVALSVAGSVGVAVGALAPPSDFPAQDPHNAALTQDPHKHMTARGEKAMGFDQAATSHHFFLFDDGGAIEVTVKQRSDKKNLAAIRTHLPEIVRLFAKGDFATHGVVHAQEVPGTEEMTRLKDRIAYAYEDIRDGGRVRIRTRHATALAAVYDFLRFQIQDHKTGDSLEITKSRELEQGDQEITRIY